MRLFLTVQDFSDHEIQSVLCRAEELSLGALPPGSGSPQVLGLVFLEASLRTRIGYAAAAARLGWHSVEVLEQRATAPGFAESCEDTIRIASGYCDVVVARPGRSLTHPSIRPYVTAPIINGGDTGPAAEHPSQAIIDLFAIERFRGPIEHLTVAIIGDVRMRAVRSLLALLCRRRPRRTILVSHPKHLSQTGAVADMPWLTVAPDLSAATRADVVYVAGMPHGSVDVGDRRQLVVNDEFVRRLSDRAVILSPMPVLDEVDPAVREDARVRFHEQSDLALFVRMAILELALSSRASSRKEEP